MPIVGTPVCAICSAQRSGYETWFLIAENRWEDKLKILWWDDQLAQRWGIVPACGAAHLQELVVHWMTTGRLDYPFAGLGWRPAHGHVSRWRPKRDIDTRGARQVGELAVDRESMERLLSESPQSLRAILDALLGALHDERAPKEVEVDPADQPVWALPQV